MVQVAVVHVIDVVAVGHGRMSAVRPVDVRMRVRGGRVVFHGSSVLAGFGRVAHGDIFPCRCRW